ncbi:L-ascorbate metabolism protein UlaG (beta-lactamase superfamily) [Pseudonocardia autotrophica]|uniref:Metal-dependent hydrolase n=1 Tax=Pseudonocardia autotrophica TaxID=2074 RepID=A0A1Y2N2Y7_PSEAH|nr:metal-dependent hydrolase [Pseudonocardia autotrophica]TDN71112.1 L-ascorbate metabolism protein UlaG (beta-lactamase superfamily) [Pseudonocardia autotrophica]
MIVSRFSRAAGVTALTAPLLGLTGLALHVRRNMGASRAQLRRVTGRSPNAVDGIFANTEPGLPRAKASARMLLNMLRSRTTEGVPAGPVPLAPLDQVAEPSGLAVTWLGHACVLLEIDGMRVLVDPVWSEYATPVPRFGPRRLHPPVAPLSALGEIDMVLLTHDHYDHLDRPTVLRLARDTRAVFVGPLGVGAHLRAWGIAGHRVVERDWDDVVQVAGLTLTCLETRHFSGRGIRRNTTLWAAWKVAGPRHCVYLGGDTGPSRVHARTGAEHGPFDLTVLPIGAYADLWPDVHADPEQAVAAHRDLRGQVLLPIHWATFNLGFHPWDEPAERARKAAAAQDVLLALPQPGRRIDLDVAPGTLRDTVPTEPWWPTPR